MAMATPGPISRHEDLFSNFQFEPPKPMGKYRSDPLYYMVQYFNVLKLIMYLILDPMLAEIAFELFCLCVKQE